MKKHLVVALVVCGALGIAYFATTERDVRVGMRELKLPRVDKTSISKIEYEGEERFALKRQNNRFVLEFNENSVRRSVPASRELTDELFVALNGIRGGTYIAERMAKHDELKVTEEKGQKVTLFVGEKPVWSLIIGDYAEEGGRYVRAPDNNAVFLVKARFWDITRSGPTDFRERSIFELGESEISAVRFESGGSQLVGFARDEKDNFGFDSSSRSLYPNVQVSLIKAAEYVKSVAKLRASAFVEDDDTLRKVTSLLEKSSDRIVITPKNHSIDVVLKMASDRKEKKAYVQVLGSTTIFEISDYAFNHLHAKGEDFAQTSLQEKKDAPESENENNNLKSLSPQMQKQIQEAIKKQQANQS